MNSMCDPQAILEKDIESGMANVTTTGQINSETMEVYQRNMVIVNKKLESVAIDLRDINKIKTLCRSVEKSYFPVAEVCLSAAGLFAGACLSAIISGIQIDSSLKSILFYSVSPGITIGCIVAFFFMRGKEHTFANTLATHILEYLPDDGYVENKGGTDR